VSVARIAVPALVSNSYFPAIAAIEVGFFAREGLDVAHELIFPNYKAYEAALLWQAGCYRERPLTNESLRWSFATSGSGNGERRDRFRHRSCGSHHSAADW
jgi:hypothetical protein